MSKYFEEKIEQKILMSEYLAKSEYSKDTIRKYIEHVGDMKMTPLMIEMFIAVGEGHYPKRYDVKTDIKTVKTIYDLTFKYPMLTPDAIEAIWDYYIKDLFEDYLVIPALEKCVGDYPLKDESFETFIKYLDKSTQDIQKRYEMDAWELYYDYKDVYSKEYIQYLSRVITKRHISYKKIVESLPSPELVEQDELLLESLFHKDCWSNCEPISYKMTMLLAYLSEDESFEDYTKEQPSYYLSAYKKEIPTLFTRQEFLDSIKGKKVKKLERK